MHNLIQQILVVDDNKLAADLMVKLLNRSGFEAHSCYSGVEALNWVLSIPLTFILLDIGMPEMDGHEVARLLRKKGYDGTLIALTGYSEEPDRVQIKLSGFDHHLIKPVCIKEVLQVLSKTKDSHHISIG